MKLSFYVVDAFTSTVFHGNPAAVCPLDAWPGDALMQNIAAENNLPETAFLVPEGSGWRLRWFTPLVEIELCGHATLASAVVLALRNPVLDEFRFHTLSGELVVTRSGERYTLDFPVRDLAPLPGNSELAAALGCPVLQLTQAGHKHAIAELESEAAVRACRPDFAALAALPWAGINITARGGDCDFVSRFFAPKVGVLEDPVTGSAHCTLIPYWSARLGKQKLHAFQISKRGGELFCELHGDRVSIAGHSVTYSTGTIHLPH